MEDASLNVSDASLNASSDEEDNNKTTKAMANSPLVSLLGQPESGKKGAKVMKRKGDSSAKTAVPKSAKKMKKGVVVKLEQKNVGPTSISKLVQNLLSFMAVTRINSTGKTKKSEELHKLAKNDYSNLVRECLEKSCDPTKTKNFATGIMFSIVDEYKRGQITENQLLTTRGETKINGEKVWHKGQKMIAEVNKAVSNPNVKALLKKHLTQMSNLPDVPEEPGTKQKEDEIEVCFTAASGDTDMEIFLSELLELLQEKDVADKENVEDDEVEIVSITLPFLALKYFLVLPELHGYTDKVVSERNFVVRYLFPSMVTFRSQTDIEEERKAATKTIAASAAERVVVQKQLSNARDKLALLIANFSSVRTALAGELNNLMLMVKDAEIYGLGEDELKTSKTQIKTLSQELSTLRVQHQLDHDGITVSITEFETRLTELPIIPLPTVVKTVKKTFTPAKKTFMPNKT